MILSAVIAMIEASSLRAQTPYRLPLCNRVSREAANADHRGDTGIVTGITAQLT